MRKSWSIKQPLFVSSKKRKTTHVEEPEIENILSMLGGGQNNEGPSLKPCLGDNDDTKLYIRENHIYFQDDINFDTASALIKEINDLANELKFIQMQYKFPEPPSIVLHITSPGGAVFAAYSIIDCMERCKVPVHTMVDGFSASCGTLISIHGKKRMMGKNACMLIHQLSSGMWGHYTEAEQQDHHENVNQMSDRIRQFYKDKTNMSNKQLKELLKHDLDWDADECLRRGLIDEII